MAIHVIIHKVPGPGRADRADPKRRAAGLGRADPKRRAGPAAPGRLVPGLDRAGRSDHRSHSEQPGPAPGGGASRLHTMAIHVI